MAAPDPTPSASPNQAPPPTPARFQGRRVVFAILLGALIGVAVGLFLESIVRNAPTRIDAGELVWVRRLLGAAGALSGLAIETMRQLQAASSDPAYHQRPRGFRGPW